MKDRRKFGLSWATGANLNCVTSAGAPDIRFNLSHSGEIALCAVTKGRDIGVDIEQIRPVSAWRQITASYFSARENQVLRSLAEDQVIQAFFQGWTRKEAYTKALGEGVSQRWTQFTVSMQPGAQAELVNASTRSTGGRSLHTLPSCTGSGIRCNHRRTGNGMAGALLAVVLGRPSSDRIMMMQLFGVTILRRQHKRYGY